MTLTTNMQEMLQPGAKVPAADALLRQLRVPSAPACFAKLERLPCLVAFMVWPEYRESLLEGAR